jgi:hypothetical protein
VPLGGIQGAQSISGGLAFGSKYVVIGHDASAVPWVWTTADGAAWGAVELGQSVPPCPDYEFSADAAVYGGATNGRQIVLVGMAYPDGVTTCGTQRAVAWLSFDGHSWQRSRGFGPIDGFSDAKKVWSVDGGWEALVWTGSGDPMTLWRSTDGLSWSSVGPLYEPPWTAEDPDLVPEVNATIDAAHDGTRVMTLWAWGSDPEVELGGLRSGQSRLRASWDGASWVDVAWDFNGSHDQTTLSVVAPGLPAGDDGWLIVADHSENGPKDLWRSSDLVGWRKGTFPMEVIEQVTLTRYGYLANGRIGYCGDGGECPPNPAVQFVSPDGLAWTAFNSSVDADLFVDGPAGVLALGGHTQVSVWRLVP